MRIAWRIVVFDAAAPLLSAAAFVMIGVALAWPVWWWMACVALCSMVIASVAFDFYLMRRGGVSVGTDPHGGGLRSASLALATAAPVAAALVGYTQWWVPERAYHNDADDVVRLAASVSEATATFSPQDPTSSIEKAAGLMPSDRADVFKGLYGRTARELADKNLVGQAAAISAGVEAISSEAASVAVIMRTSQGVPGSPPAGAVQALRVELIKRDGQWTVFEVTPIRGPATGQFSS